MLVLFSVPIFYGGRVLVPRGAVPGYLSEVNCTVVSTMQVDVGESEVRCSSPTSVCQTTRSEHTVYFADVSYESGGETVEAPFCRPLPECEVASCTLPGGLECEHDVCEQLKEGVAEPSAVNPIGCYNHQRRPDEMSQGSFRCTIGFLGPNYGDDPVAFTEEAFEEAKEYFYSPAHNAPKYLGLTALVLVVWALQIVVCLGMGRVVAKRSKDSGRR